MRAVLLVNGSLLHKQPQMTQAVSDQCFALFAITTITYLLVAKMILSNSKMRKSIKDMYSELQIRWGFEDNSEIVFLLSQGKSML